MKMEKSGGNKDDVDICSINEVATRKGAYIPFGEVIEKFHKIREHHMKDKHRINCENLGAESQAGVNVKEDKVNVTTGTGSQRPNSARQKLCNQPKSEIGSARRRSLPSIFRPGTITPGVDIVDGGDGRPTRRDPRTPTHVGVSCGLNRRRFSLPYVIKEYAKEDLDHLEAKLSEQNGDALRDVKDKGNEKSEVHGINGKELHAFYNMWKSSCKPMRKRIPRRLEAILRENEMESSEGRARGFSF